MPAAPEGVVDFPTLWVSAEWIQAHAVIPDGIRAGDPFELTDQQLWCWVNHYRIRPKAKRGQLAPAFFYRRSQVVGPQKVGKSPFAAAMVCAEGVGPVLFAGWAKGGELYRCRDHGCRCGWWYEYEPGEPMGQPWSTPLIQVTATSEEQTDNIYDALRPMIDNGPLHELIPKTGEEFIRLPNRGRIDVVTSNARSRLGQRVTFVPMDETGIWTPQSGMVKVAETQRRGLAGMGGRAIELTNPWDPSENSVAQRTAESGSEDVFRFHREPPANLSYRNKRERRRIHAFAYAGSPWVDLDAIESEAAELIKTDPAQAERFFGNRIVAGSDSFLEDPLIWDAQKAPRVVTKGQITVGFDGSMFDDWTALRCRLWADGAWYGFTPVFPDGKPMIWNPTEHGGQIPRSEVTAGVDLLFKQFTVLRMYCDPELFQSEIDAWAAKHGEKRVIPWATNRPRPMHAALERWTTDLQAKSFEHDGCPITTTHVRNARKVRRGAYVLVGKPADHQKIDAMVCDVLAHEAAGDVMAAGELVVKKKRYAYTA